MKHGWVLPYGVDAWVAPPAMSAPIDACVAELAAALRGPRRVRADVLAEARDGLVDAAEAYEAEELDRTAAERRAVRDFGDVADVALEYRAELGLAQARRTALLTFGVMAALQVVSAYAWRGGTEPAALHPDPLYSLLARTVDWLGIVAVAGALAAVFACGIAVRWLRAGCAVARATGVFALAVCVVFALAGAALTVLNPGARSLLLTVAGPPMVALFWGLPAWIAWSARRCLVTA